MKALSNNFRKQKPNFKVIKKVSVCVCVRHEINEGEYYRRKASHVCETEKINCAHDGV